MQVYALAIVQPILASIIPPLPYVFGGRLRILVAIHPRRWLSFGAGVAVSYVFIQLLPELAGYQERFLAATAQQALLFAERRVFLAALVGFVLYYGLENFVAWSRASRAARGQEGHSTPVYRLHVAGFAVYSALIGSVLVRVPMLEPPPLAFFPIAMCLLFLVFEPSLYPE